MRFAKFLILNKTVTYLGSVSELPISGKPEELIIDTGYSKPQPLLFNKYYGIWTVVEEFDVDIDILYSAYNYIYFLKSDLNIPERV